MRLDPEQQKRILPLKAKIVESFDRQKWLELGMLTGCLEEVRGHPRLLRSWDFGDDDYPGHILDMLVTMITRDVENLKIVEDYVWNGEVGSPVTVETGRRRVTFLPTVFDLPDSTVDLNLVAVMMPFDAAFDKVYSAIKLACKATALHCQRVDDIWLHATVIQDVFDLIWRSSMVVCDFSGRNPNVFYECGIAHTLGKPVVPITQQKGDVPFDLQHHRFLQYHANGEGLSDLSIQLEKRLRTLSGARH